MDTLETEESSSQLKTCNDSIEVLSPDGSGTLEFLEFLRKSTVQKGNCVLE